MFKVNSLLGALGVSLIIALYLVLVNSTGAARVVGSVGGTTNTIFSRTLQGR